MIYNAVSVSGIQLSDAVIHVSILFQILFPYRLSQNTEQNLLHIFDRDSLVPVPGMDQCL